MPISRFRVPRLNSFGRAIKKRNVKRLDTPPGLGEVYGDGKDRCADGGVSRTPFAFSAYKANEQTKLG
jgi:hypothetical protein